ncbi:MAG: FAD-binding oxidoreductase [Bacillota bacterium]
MKKWDVVVVGAGMIGLAAAYELVKKGAKTALLDAGGLGSGASAANMGLVISTDAEPGLISKLTSKSLELLERLSLELEYDLNYREKSFIDILYSKEDLLRGEKMAAGLKAKGFECRLLTPRELQGMEPGTTFPDALGGLYTKQGSIDPFSLLYGYYQAARKKDLDWFPYTKVIGFETSGAKVTGVCTRQMSFHADTVVLAAGAWTRELAALLGYDLPQYYIHGECMVTEVMPPILNSCVGLPVNRVEFEDSVSCLAAKNGWENLGLMDECDLVVVQVHNGNLIIGQKTYVHPEFKGDTTYTGMAEMAKKAVRVLPDLSYVSVIRSWVSPVPFTPDHQPFLGPLGRYENLIVSSGYKSTIILTPLAGKLVSRMALGESLDYALEEFYPGRFTEKELEA